jgi:hypothetical protein
MAKLIDGEEQKHYTVLREIELQDIGAQIVTQNGGYNEEK